MLGGLEVTTLPWLPRRLYVEASSPLEVRQNLPLSHLRAYKEIVLLLLQEGTSLKVYKSRKTLPGRSWVRIKQSALYKGDVGYVETSDENNAVVIVVPRQRPYDIPEQSGERMEFSIELARLADLELEAIVSPSGAEIGFSCGEQQFVYGLLRLPLPLHSLELVELPHPDDIRYHVMADFDRQFVEQTLLLFLAQFWREKDKVEIKEGDLKGKTGTLGDIDWNKQTAIVLCDDDVFDCSLRELRRKFNVGDAVKVIAGPFSGETGHVVIVHGGTVVLVVLQQDGTSDNVSRYHCSTLDSHPDK